MSARIGFSTRKYNIVSKIIRFLTKSKVSHSFLVLKESYFEQEFVLEATTEGVRLVPFKKFEHENDVIGVFTPDVPIDAGVRAQVELIGEMYDVPGLLGSAFVLLGRWFKKKWKNPFRSTKSQFCSELVTRALQSAKYPGTEDLDPESTTPQDLYELFYVDGIPRV